MARVEQVRLGLVAQLEASRGATAATAAERDRAVAERDALRARLASTSLARSTASRGGRRGSVVRTRPVGPCGGWAALVGSYAWPVGTMCSVLVCESRGDPNARNASGHNGLFQIAGGPFDPAANVHLAFSMWSRRGLQPWADSRGCWG